MQYQIELLKALFRGAGATEIVVLFSPSEEQVVKALSDSNVQGAAYLGHGPSGEVASGGSWQSELNDDGEIFDSTTMERIAKKRRHPMMMFVLCACEGQNAVANLAQIAYSILYSNGPHQALMLATGQMEKWAWGMPLPKTGRGSTRPKRERRGKIGGGGMRKVNRHETNR